MAGEFIPRLLLVLVLEEFGWMICIVMEQKKGLDFVNFLAGATLVPTVTTTGTSLLIVDAQPQVGRPQPLNNTIIRIHSKICV